MGSINIVLLKDIASEIQDFKDSIPTEFKTRVIEGSKEDFAYFISVYIPFREGGLAGGIIVIDTGEYDYFFDNERYYNPFVILGTQPHWIGSPVLINDSWVYIGMHPGTAPQDYMEMAFEPGSDAVDPRLEDMADWMESSW